MPDTPYAGLAKDHNSGVSIESRFPVPAGFARISVSEGSFARWLRGLPLLPESAVSYDWQKRAVFNPDEVGGVLDWRLLGPEEQCADIALRLLAEFARLDANGSDPVFRSLSGDEIRWSRWLRGRYGTNQNATAIVYRADSPRTGSRSEYDRFLKFVMNYTNTASMARDWPIIAETELVVGDVIIQPHCTGEGMGHLSVIVDACEDSAGARSFIFVDGYTPARDPVVRQRVTGDRSTVWMTAAEYLDLQQQFGPGKFHRFPGW